jgi:hypothetical protein
MVDVIRGRVTHHLEVHDETELGGLAPAGATVYDGAVLDVRGQVGSLRLQEGARARLGGQCTGDVYVAEGARLDVTGMVLGRLLQNDGVVTLAVGARLGKYMVSEDGLLVEPVGSHVITESTPRFAVVGTSANLALAAPPSEQRP